MWSPAVAGSQRLPAQVPSGAIPKVVAAFSFHELPYASWPVEVKAEFVPTPTVPAGPETVIPVSGPCVTVRLNGPALRPEYETSTEWLPAAVGEQTAFGHGEPSTVTAEEVATFPR